jgi:hypothetical protein
VQRGEINNMGYVAPFDYAPGSEATVIFGDSYIEGLMNRYEDTLPAQLGTSGGADSAPLLNFGNIGVRPTRLLGARHADSRPLSADLDHRVHWRWRLRRRISTCARVIFAGARTTSLPWSSCRTSFVARS